MTRQTWTAIVSAVMFVVLAGVIALVPVPFVGWGPGQTYDVLGEVDGHRVIQISGVHTYEPKGELRMTTVSVTRPDSHLSLPEALVDYVAPNHHVLPRDSVYPTGRSVEETEQIGKTQMTSAQASATVAALRTAGIPVQQNPVVVTASVGSPAYGKIQVGDVIETVDNNVVATSADVRNLIRKHQVGDQVILGLDRGGLKTQLKIVTAASPDDSSVPQIGLTATDGYRYEPKVTFGLGSNVEGPSGGLILALGIYEMLTPDDLLYGRTVAGTGQIDENGAVNAISGVREKIRGAENAHAQVFLLPAANCADITDMSTTMTIVKVTKLSDAISSLKSLHADPTAVVPRC